MIKSIPKNQHEYLHKGLTAHLLRRAIHLSSIFLLWFYYQYGISCANFLGVSLQQLVELCLGFVLTLELIRLRRGWLVFGQRSYEKNQISAFAWSAVGMALVLLFAPGKAFVIPIIAAYALGDPLLGELRRQKLPKMAVILIGIAVITGIWWLAYLQWGTPLWTLFVMGPVTVAVECVCFPWIDDNALMQIIPLIIVLITAFLSTG